MSTLLAPITAADYARQHVHTTCWHTEGSGKTKKRCQRKATRWAGHQWWCAQHAPPTTPDPACTHSLTSIFFGVEVCAWCGGHLETNPA